MTYELYYWPGIPGRGEYVRLALEAAGASYVDVAKDPGGEDAALAKIGRVWNDMGLPRPPFAPPALKDGDLLIAQTANILLYLGPRHALAPDDEAGRLWTHQLQLTIADWVAEIHDTHHPLGPMRYYEDQKPEAHRRAEEFLEHRLPKYFGYFETVLERNPAGAPFLVGNALSYVDLSLFQTIEGLRYAFPQAMGRIEKKSPKSIALHQRIAETDRVAAYLTSERRMPFNDAGIFRHYPELDA